MKPGKQKTASPHHQPRLDQDLGSGSTNPPQGEGPSAGLVIDAESDLYLTSCPAYLQDLLDELPLQVFFKKAEFVDGLGREYTYLNRAARAILKWEAQEVPGRYDSEAFQGGAENRQWREMVAAETRTIENGVRTATDLQWTSPLGDEWRINRVVQLPICFRAANEDALHVVGFCSIAQDIEFKQFQKTNQFFTRAVLHEYGNLCNALLSDIAHAREYPDLRERYLVQAENRAIGAKGIAAALFEAVRHLDSTEMSTVGAAVANLQALTKRLPIHLETDVPDSLSPLRFPQPRVALAVLLQLVANGEKHTPEELRREGLARIWLKLRSPSDRTLEWTVSNLRTRLDGRLDLGESTTSVSLGGAILGNIVRRAYRVKDAEEVIIFPDAVGPDKRVNVRFLSPRENV